MFKPNLDEIVFDKYGDALPRATKSGRVLNGPMTMRFAITEALTETLPIDSHLQTQPYFLQQLARLGDQLMTGEHELDPNAIAVVMDRVTRYWGGYVGMRVTDFLAPGLENVGVKVADPIGSAPLDQ